MHCCCLKGKGLMKNHLDSQSHTFEFSFIYIKYPDTNIGVKPPIHQTDTDVVSGMESMASEFLTSSMVILMLTKGSILFYQILFVNRYLNHLPLSSKTPPFLSWLIIFLMSLLCTTWILFHLTYCFKCLIEKTIVFHCMKTRLQ